MKKNYTFLVSLCLLIYGFAFTQPTQPSNPAAGNSNNCTTNAAILTCPQNSSNIQANFSGGIYNRGNDGNHLGVGAIWRFKNITTSAGIQVNAEVKLDAIFNAILENAGTGSNTSSTANIEDDNATNQSGTLTANFFAPRIKPNVPSSPSTPTSPRGYVQFTITFFKNNIGDGFNRSIGRQPLANLNFVHLDIDGSGNSTQWFRETGVALGYDNFNPQVMANAGTELVNYSYTDNTTSPGGVWKGFAGSVFERDGVSTCAEVAVAFKYAQGTRDSITFRMGYDAKGMSSTEINNFPTRQYGATFGCFNFPSQISLPVKLINFSGSYRNEVTLLNWETQELNFSHYDIERSNNGADFAEIGNVAGQNSADKQQYQYTDNLSAAVGDVFYYRLKMVDIDGKATYSNVILIRKDTKTINGISISPNPVRGGGAVSVRFTAVANTFIDLRVIDMTGKVVLRQQNKVYEGNNSISVDNLDRLQPGVYVLQINGDAAMMNKFSIIR